MRKQEYYCDYCNKQVQREEDLHRIEITFGASEGIIHKEVCFECWVTYNERLGEIAKDMFKNNR